MNWLEKLEPLKFYISAHNTQPFKLEIDQDHFRVLVDESRLLPVGDPHQRDLQMGLGAFLAALETVLQSQNFKIASFSSSPSASMKNPIVTLKIEPAPGTADSLENQTRLKLMTERFSYRGAFQKAAINPDLEQGLKKFNIFFSAEAPIKSAIAQLYDTTNLKTLSRPAYLSELYSWMRFSKSHPRWSDDGLNAEGIHLSAIEAVGASLILKPAVFSVLNKLGLGGAMISEKTQISSAQFIVAFTAPPTTDFIEQGKIFFNQWLNLTKLGLFGAPLSLLTEEESTAAAVKQLLRIPSQQILVNLLRCGPLPKNYQRYAPARLDISRFVQQRS